MNLFTVSFLSFSSLVLLAGCGSPTAPTKAPPSAAHEEHAHEHPSHGPHEGELIELGKEEFHLEMTHDDATHTVALYVLDGAAKAAVPIDATELMLNLVVDSKPVAYKLPAKRQSADPEGKSSCFELSDEKLCTALDAKGTTGRVNLTINEKPYSGNVGAHDHDHGDHKH
jgi:hypothetical protein